MLNLLRSGVSFCDTAQITPIRWCTNGPNNVEFTIEYEATRPVHSRMLLKEAHEIIDMKRKDGPSDAVQGPLKKAKTSRGAAKNDQVSWILVSVKLKFRGADRRGKLSKPRKGRGIVGVQVDTGQSFVKRASDAHRVGRATATTSAKSGVPNVPRSSRVP